MNVVILTVAIIAINKYIIRNIINNIIGKLINLFNIISIGYVVFIFVVSLVDSLKLKIFLTIILTIRGIGIIIINLRFVLNFSFEAILVIYINRTNIPPTITRNKIYENQKFWYRLPDNNLIAIVCINKINPVDNGCFIEIKSIENSKFNDISPIIISRSSLN